MNQIRESRQTKSAPLVEHFRILSQFMVRSIDLSWNQIETSLIFMYEKLIQLGFVYHNKEIQIYEPVEKQKNV